jgi:hypothetical protein
MAGSRVERFPAVSAPPVPAKQKNALTGRSGGCKRHAKYPSFRRQRQFFRSKSSNVQNSKNRALVTWWLLPAAKTSLVLPLWRHRPYAL